MTLTVTITATSKTKFTNDFTASASATISGSTNQPSMSDKQMEQMKCDLLKILTNSTPTLSNNSNLKSPITIAKIAVSIISDTIIVPD
jgi:hypothetical protein